MDNIMEDIRKKLTKCADGLKIHLSQDAPETFEEQKHTDLGTPERAYWHYGYLSALNDALALMERDSTPWC